MSVPVFYELLDENGQSVRELDSGYRSIGHARIPPESLKELAVDALYKAATVFRPFNTEAVATVKILSDRISLAELAVQNFANSSDERHKKIAETFPQYKLS